MKKLLLALILGSSLAYSYPLKTVKGEVEIEKVPAKIAVFDVGVLDNLDALGIKVAAMPDKLRPLYLAESQKQAQTVGTLFEPDLEKLAAIQPDLIIVAARSAPKLDAVSQVGKAVDLTLDNKNAYSQSLERLNEFANIFNKQEEAKAITARIEKLKDEVKDLAQNQGKVLAILVNGPKLSLYGKGSRIGWVEETLGLSLIDKEKDPNASGHGNPISFEFIAEQNPDWIFVIDRAAAIGQDLTAAKTVLDTPLVQETQAGKKGQILYLSPEEIYIDIGGVQALEKTLTELKTAFLEKVKK